MNKFIDYSTMPKDFKKFVKKVTVGDMKNFPTKWMEIVSNAKNGNTDYILQPYGDLCLIVFKAEVIYGMWNNVVGKVA